MQAIKILISYDCQAYVTTPFLCSNNATIYLTENINIMNRKITKCLLLLLGITGPKLMAQPLYGHYLDKVAPQGGDVLVKGTAYDTAGNMYIAGQFRGTATFNNTTTLTTVKEAAFVAKINSHGQTVWAKQETGNISGSYDGANDIAVDRQGNVYIIGDGSAGAMFGTFTPDNGTHDYTNGFFVKMDNNGNVLWAKGSNSMYPTSLYADNNNNIYLAGYISDDSTFLGGTYFPGDRNGQNAGFVWKVDGNFNLLAHFLTYSSTSINDIDGDASGNIAICGTYGQTLMFDNGVPIANPTGGPGNSYNGFVAKLNNSLTSIWAKPCYDSYEDEFTAVTLDGSGNVYAGGTYSDTIIIDGTHTFRAPTVTSHNHVLIKYDGTGNVGWAKSFGTGQTNTIAVAGLAYSSATQKLWGLFNADHGEDVGGNIINDHMGIANINPADGSIPTMIQSTSDASAYGGRLATWDSSVAVVGSFIENAGPTNGNMTLLGLTASYIYSYESGFAFEFGNSPYANAVTNVNAAGNDIKVFPNPATGIVTVTAPDSKSGTITLSSMLGLTLITQPLETSNQLNLTSLPKGIYIVNVRTTEGMDVNKKVVLQ